MTVRVVYTDGKTEEFRKGTDISSDSDVDGFIAITDEDETIVASVNSDEVRSITVD